MSNYHFFGTTNAGWVSANTLVEVTRRMNNMARYDLTHTFKSMGYAIYRVPLPPDAHYAIEFFTPKVKGVQLLETGTVTLKGRSVVYTPGEMKTEDPGAKAEDDMPRLVRDQA